MAKFILEEGDVSTSAEPADAKQENTSKHQKSRSGKLLYNSATEKTNIQKKFEGDHIQKTNMIAGETKHKTTSDYTRTHKANTTTKLDQLANSRTQVFEGDKISFKTVTHDEKIQADSISERVDSKTHTINSSQSFNLIAPYAEAYIAKKKLEINTQNLSISGTTSKIVSKVAGGAAQSGTMSQGTQVVETKDVFFKATNSIRFMPPADQPSSNADKLNTASFLDRKYRKQHEDEPGYLIIDYAYDPSEQVFYGLNELDYNNICLQSRRLSRNIESLDSEIASVKKQGNVTGKVKYTLDDIHKSLLELQADSNNSQLAELIHFGIPGYSYVPKSFLAKLSHKISLEEMGINPNQDQNSQGNSQGEANSYEVASKENEGKQKQKGKRIKGSGEAFKIQTLKDKLEAKSVGVDLLQPQNIDPYEANLNDWVKSFNSDKPLDWSSKNGGFNASSGAKLLRFTSGLGAAAGFDPLKGKLLANIAANAKIDVFKGELSASAYWPTPSEEEPLTEAKIQDKNGKELNLGIFVTELTISASEFIGASLMLNTGVEVKLFGESCKLKGYNIEDKGDHKDNEKTKKPQVTVGANAALFAGIQVGGELKGKLLWIDYKCIYKIPRDKSVQAIACVGGGVDAAAGIGANVDFAINYADNKFYLVCKADLVLGLGTGGKISFEVDANTIENFIKFIYRQLEENNYDYTSLMEGAIYKVFTQIMMLGPVAKKTIQELALYGLDTVTDWMDRQAQAIYGQKQRSLQFSQAILSEVYDSVIQYAPPAVKGRWLYEILYDAERNQWDYFVVADPKTGEVKNEYQELSQLQYNAGTKVMNWIQTGEEYDKIMENFVPFDSDETISSAYGKLLLWDDAGSWFCIWQAHQVSVNEERVAQAKAFKANLDGKFGLYKAENAAAMTPNNFMGVFIR